MNMISNCFKHKKEIFERTLKIIIAVASANNNNSEKVTIAEVVHYKEEIMATSTTKYNSGRDDDRSDNIPQDLSDDDGSSVASAF